MQTGFAKARGSCRLTLGKMALFCASALLCAAGQVLGQTTFQHVHWTNTDEKATSIVQTNDGGYAYVANRTTTANIQHIFLIKTDQYGYMQWVREYGSSIAGANMAAQSVRQLSTGGYIIGGETSGACQGNQILLMKTDAVGTLVAARAYAGSGFSNVAGVPIGGTVVRERMGGGFILVGRRFGAPNILSPVLIETDVNLNQTNAVFYTDNRWGTQTFMTFNDVRQNPDGSYIVTGWTRRGDTGPAEMLAMRALPVSPIGWGMPAWFRSYYTFAAAGGPDYRGEGLDIAPPAPVAGANGPTFVFTGTVTTTGASPASYVCRADYNGNFIWEAIYPQFRNARSIRTNSLGRFVVAGQDTTANNAAIMEVLPSGLANWARSYNNGDPQVQQSEEIIPTNDGGYISCGYTVTPPNLSDCHLIKMDANGRTCLVTDLQTPQTPDQVQRDIPWSMGQLPQPCVPPIVTQQLQIEDTVICIRRGCVTPPANMTLWLPMDELAGNVAFNAAGGNNGTHINGNAVGAAGEVAAAKCYNGLNQYTQVNSYAGLNPGGGAFSTDAWIKWNGGQPGSIHQIVDKRLITTSPTGSILSRGYDLFLITDASGTTAKLWAQIGVGATWANYNSNLTVTAGQWTMVGLSVTRGNATGIRFYAAPDTATNLTPGTSSSSIPLAGAITNASPFRVGRDSWTLGQHFNGCIDEVEFFRRDLTAAEFESIFDAKSSGKCKVGCAVPNLYFCDPAINTVSGIATTYNFAGPAFSPTGYWFNGMTLGSLGSNIAGPTSADFAPSSGTTFTPFPGFGSVPFTLTRPAAMTFVNATAAYQMFAQFPTSTGIIRSGAGLAVDLRYLCGNWNLPIGLISLPTGALLSPNLAVSSHAPTVVSVPYRLRAIGPDMEPDLYSLRLNGLPPGQPVLGTLTVAPGGTTSIPCRVMFELADPTALYTILLEADLDGDGTYEPLASFMLHNDDGPPCVADVDDGSGLGNPDDGVGIEDLLFYLDEYDAGDTGADVDDGSGTGTPDGGVGIEDLLYYLQRYDAGC